MVESTTVVPSAAVVAAATVVRAAWAAVGLVNPGMLNVIGLPAPNVPADIVTVKTDPARAAAPAGLPVLGAVNVRVPAPVRAKPAPESVMTILPLFARASCGVRVTDMTTPVAPLVSLLRVMAVGSVPAST